MDFGVDPALIDPVSTVRLLRRPFIKTGRGPPSAVILDAEGAAGVSLNLAFMRGLSLMGAVPRD